MKSFSFLRQKFLKDKKAVFGLSSVQQFFAIILGVALLAYVIVVIMGTLSDSTILTQTASSVTNETGNLTFGGYQLSNFSVTGFASPTIVYAINSTSNATIPSTNYTVSANGFVTKTAEGDLNYSGVLYTYTYNKDSNAQIQTDAIAGNTSGGITSFFGSINPVYAILAILVIILVLIVLVRVVTGGTGAGRRTEPQL